MHEANFIEKARALLKQAEAISVLTGAGISAESGIRTFRDNGGLWDEMDVEKVATPGGFARDPRLVWRFYNERRKAAQSAQPNPAHLALATMERRLKPHGRATARARGMHPKHSEPMTILTQNIDGLHQKAGSHNVIELHGSLWKVRCTACGAVSSNHPVELPILPHCADCGALLRPHVVWFGEPLDRAILADSEEALEGCDLMFVVGTSAVVQPAASLPLLAVRRGVPIIEVNPEETPISGLATVSLRGKAGEILPKLT